MLRRTILVLLTGFLVLLTGPADAAPPTAAPTTTTVTEQGVVATFEDVLPTCEDGGALYTITTTSNDIQHMTAFDDGRTHETFTSTGTFTAAPLTDTSLPTYTGKFTIWGGFNQNRSRQGGTFTFNVRGTGSDGSTLAYHSVSHFGTRPDMTTREFFHCH